jgi:hypothetical protein
MLFQRVESRQDIVFAVAGKPTVGINTRGVRIPCEHHCPLEVWSFNVVLYEDSNVAGHPTYQLDHMDGNLRLSSI